MKQTLRKLFEYHTLPRQDAREIMLNMAHERYNHAEMVAFMSVFLMRPVTVEELSGFREALLELCRPVDLRGIPAIDLCGTGGDGKNTFNISTLTAFVVAGAGIPVAKHGNYGVSSVCGSSNVLEALGVKFSDRPDVLLRQLDQSGICFLHAPLFHPALKVVAPIRRELGIKTFFNMLGPLVNPASPPNQMCGVYNLELARLYNYLFQQTTHQFTIVHSLDGYDEISLTDNFKAITRNGDHIVTPAQLGFRAYSACDIEGGSSVHDARKIFVDILEGQGTEAQNAVVKANAAMAICCARPETPLSEALQQAHASLMERKALQTLHLFLSMQ